MRSKGIDPDRLSVTRLGFGSHKAAVPAWLIRMSLGIVLSALLHLAGIFEHGMPLYLEAIFSLILGLIILQAACEVLVIGTERLAARYKWNHYIAGTLAEILSTTPELVVIAFLIPVSPETAFIIGVITIYNNALVFSLYSFFLPKDKQGKFDANTYYGGGHTDFNRRRFNGLDTWPGDADFLFIRAN